MLSSLDKQIQLEEEEILKLFSDFTTISISDEYSLDLFHGEPHYHGIIKYIGQKVK